MSEAEIKRYLAKIGAKGGSVSSTKKLAALKVSLAFARLVKAQKKLLAEKQKQKKDISK